VANEATIVGMTSHLGNLASVYERVCTQAMALRWRWRQSSVRRCARSVEAPLNYVGITSCCSEDVRPVPIGMHRQKHYWWPDTAPARRLP